MKPPCPTPPAAPAIRPTARTTLGRHPERGVFDRDAVYHILDHGLVCHLGFAGPDGAPRILPTAYGRTGDLLFVHGAVANRAFRTLASGAPACVAVTVLDGLVLARSAFRHSMNYRSVILYGTAHEISQPGEKRAALDAILDHALPGRSLEARPPSDDELRATRVLGFPIAEASAKVRAGPPIDHSDDRARPIWAGHIPLAVRAGPAIPDAELIGHPPAPALAAHLLADADRPSE